MPLLPRPQSRSWLAEVLVIEWQMLLLLSLRMFRFFHFTQIHNLRWNKTTVLKHFFKFYVTFSCSPSSLCCLCFYLPPPQPGKVFELHAVCGGRERLFGQAWEKEGMERILEEVCNYRRGEGGIPVWYDVRNTCLNYVHVQYFDEGLPVPSQKRKGLFLKIQTFFCGKFLPELIRTFGGNVREMQIREENFKQLAL